jgi:hypothetical protein
VRRSLVEVRRPDLEDVEANSQPPPNIAPVSGVPNYSVRNFLPLSSSLSLSLTCSLHLP